MRRHLRTLLVQLLLLCSAFRIPHSAFAAEPFELKDGDRVLFIGDTFFERESDYGHIETRLTAAFPDRNVTFRNLAWAGDTPTGRARASFDWNKDDDFWLAHVKTQLELVKPTVAFLSYGMTAALELAETPPEDQPAKLEKFKTDLGKLMDAIDEVSGLKVRFVVLGPATLAPSPKTPKPGQAVKAAHAQVIGALEALAKQRPARFERTDREIFDWGYKLGKPFPVFSIDGVNPTSEGLEQTAFILWQSMISSRPDNYWNQPAYDVLNAAIRKKNELFFHRWRPENWTYLFGFRKGEQGQNGVEIPKFDPLIAEWDKTIAGLRDLKHQDPNAVAKVQQLTGEVSTEKTVSQNRARNHIADDALRIQSAKTPPLPIPTFDIADGFEATLWAEDPELFKPIQMNWDAQGRLWVASSRTYPMIAPGQNAADAVVVLEDTDGDHKVDKSTVFASGLLIPTGVLPDDKGGCYVAASSQLLHFADTDGDGRADQKTIVLSSFGTEDTHHNLHTLRWGYDGHMYLNQSIYTHTHIETPWGVRRLNSAGIWRFNPDNWKLEVFTRGGCNPWGHHWDQYGNEFFTDGAGFKGVYHAMEGATYFTYSDMRREAESISPGNYPKFASLEYVHSPNFPADWQGSLITCDFRAHRVVRFGLTDVGSTYQTKELPDLLRSTNVTFRPIDVRFGPDGALYIADWSNPIIQHGEVDFRDPRRDHEHGRIWRVTAKGGALAGKQNLTKLPTVALLDRTLSKSGWEQEQSRVVLRQRGESVLKEVKPWLAKQTDPRARLEAMWLHEAFEKPADDLVAGLVTAKDERLRTAAARELSR